MLVQQLRRRAAVSKAWWATQAGHFGLGFLLYLSASEFLFGLGQEWFSIFVQSFLKDEVGLDGPSTQSVRETARAAYLLRPLCGVLSDAYPLFGSTRHSWFVLASVAAGLCHLSLLLADGAVLITSLLFAIMLFGYTWIYCIQAAQLAQAAKKDPVAGAETLQTVSYAFYAGGSFFGDVSAILVLRTLCSARRALGFAGLLFFVIGLTPFLAEDESAAPGSPVAAIQASLRNKTRRSGCCRRAREDGPVPGGPGPQTEPEFSTALSTEFSTQLEGQQLELKVNPEAIREQLRGLKNQIRRLWGAVDPRGPTKGTLLRPAIFIFLCMACIPTYYDGAIFYFQMAPKEQTVHHCDGAVTVSLVRCVAVHDQILTAAEACQPLYNTTNDVGTGLLSDFHIVTTTAKDVAEGGLEGSLLLECTRGWGGQDAPCPAATAAAAAACPTAVAAIFSLPQLHGQAAVDVLGMADQWVARTATTAQSNALAVCPDESSAVAIAPGVADLCYSDESGGYGYGYDDAEKVCSDIESTRYFAMLAPPKDPTATFEGTDGCSAGISVCNVTRHDSCTTFPGGLGFSYEYYTFLQAVGNAAAIFGTWLYGAYLAPLSSRKVLVIAHLVLAAATCLDVVLALRWNISWGISDEWFSGWTIFFGWLGYQLKTLAIYSLATRLCPVGIEATVSALALSMYELGNRVKGIFGIGLTAAADIASHESFCGVMAFENLGLINVVKVFLSLLPIVYVTWLVPREAEITESLGNLARSGERPNSGGGGGLGESLAQPTLAEREDNPVTTPMAGERA
jgi:hypothetical protein